VAKRLQRLNIRLTGHAETLIPVAESSDAQPEAARSRHFEKRIWDEKD
jgi:hypothetical protein